MSMNMRQQFTATVTSLEERDERVVLLLNDIGVWAFRHLKAAYPNRVHNLGILEQASIGVSAGLALTGYIPIFHTIAPFIVERGYEQLKDDFGYQNLNGNFVSVGASFDYSALGMTHYCPGDVGALMQIPNMQIVLPGTAKEMDCLMTQAYDNGSPTYFRLSESSNVMEHEVLFGRAVVVKQGAKATVLAVGTMLSPVMEAVADLDVTVLYYTTVRPFDREALVQNMPTNKILLCEPYYSGALATEIIMTYHDNPVRMNFVGLSCEVPKTYGTVQENMAVFGMDAKSIREKALTLIEA
ncbi:transketolase C-terminal domain-containing protein [uncultured Selenomonas sp.]|uniref:transketolase family protein n=1 Tax=uncultured Selenomonas sp. TaxID=159275 RepID=UPI0028D44B33|nr:transketolase C-terminal domain-containing protein [uncultured Selenomonas sp.]